MAGDHAALQLLLGGLGAVAQLSFILRFILSASLRYAIKRCAQFAVFLNQSLDVAFLLVYFSLQQLYVLLVNVAVLFEHLALLKSLFLLLF